MNENNPDEMIEETKSPGTNLRQHQKDDDKKMLLLVIFTLLEITPNSVITRQILEMTM